MDLKKILHGALQIGGAGLKGFNDASNYVAKFIPPPPTLFPSPKPTPQPHPVIAKVQSAYSAPTAAEKIKTTQQYNNVPSEDQIRQGLLAYNPSTPLATQAAALRQGMIKLSTGTKINPVDLLTFFLRESQGGKTQAGVYNPGNVRDSTGKHKYVSYPDYNTAINGGWNPEYNTTSQGMVNTILTDPRYAEYRQTGNTNAFNSVWTPQSDNNPSAQTLTDTMMKLRSYFE